MTAPMPLFLEMRNRLSLLSLTRCVSSSLSPYPHRTFSLSSAALASRKKRMPPKKAPVQEKKVLLGRPSNNLKIGIVGTFPPHDISLFISRPLLSRRASERRQIILLQCLITDRSPKSFYMVVRLSTDFFLDLGKAANFPYATIDPEAGHLVRHSTQPFKYMR